jgi:tetratricopeptide (TPR) repeat protein
MSERMTPDLWQAARLSPRRPELWQAAIVGELTRAGLEHPEESSADLVDSWNNLSPEARKRCTGALAILKTYSADRDPSIAARSSAVLGLVALFSGDRTTATSALRRAVRLEPQTAQNWEMLFTALVMDKRWKEATELGRDYVQRFNTVHTRLLLAKAYQMAGNWDAAADQVRAASKIDPNSPAVRLGLIVIDLKQARNDAALGLITVRLNALRASLSNDTPDELRESQELTRAVLLGLEGNDSAAREIVNKLAETNKDDSAVQEVLAAIGG